MYQLPEHTSLTAGKSMLTHYQHAAHLHGLPFVNLLETPPDKGLLCATDLKDYLAFCAIPWRREGGIITIVTCEPHDQIWRWAKTCYGGEVQVALTSPYDIRCIIEKYFSPQLCWQSRLSLYHAEPKLSARITLTTGQKTGIAVLGGAGVACSITWPGSSACISILFMHGIYAVHMLFKTALFRIGRNNIPCLPVLPRHDDVLPVYTILVPIYREVSSLPRLLSALLQLDYPRSRLDIKLVLEEDDLETYGALLALRPDRIFDIIRVPASHPRTKPKALNYALRFARGTFVTVYDAEDLPHPQQLKAAVAMFRNAPNNVACLQARLNYYNTDATLLTYWFAFEYAILFNAVLSGLETLNVPIPLGGTSNHLALDRLRALGEWDPFNVTEDADLGTRLAVRGYRTMVLPSLTLEEAPIHFGPWIRQRTRWIKGYMQTWCVHMRKPVLLYKALGMRGFVCFQCFIGVPTVVFLTTPLMWLISVITLFNPRLLHLIHLPDWFNLLAYMNLLLYFGAHWWQAWHIRKVLPGAHPDRLAGALMLFPLYWVLHSLASYRALWQLVVNPHFWEKTHHGQLTAKRNAARF